ncbi:hypothetical protein OIU78_026878 [Salix suchowensis]|nr:hypothetical protein OIU78_026878 [Salix suchowensis]
MSLGRSHGDLCMATHSKPDRLLILKKAMNSDPLRAKRMFVFQGCMFLCNSAVAYYMLRKEKKKEEDRKSGQPVVVTVC